MGQTLKIHTEVKIKGKWEHYSNPWHPLMQCVQFHALFGEAEDKDIVGVILKKPRLKLAEMSDITARSYRLDEGQFALNYVNKEEIVQLEKEINRVFTNIAPAAFFFFFGFCFGNGWSSWIEYPEEVPDFAEDVRFVYWFER